MESNLPKIAYLSIEPATLLAECYRQLARMPDPTEARKLQLVGTMPSNVKANIEKTFISVDRSGVSSRFSAYNRLSLGSWSELVNLSLIATFFNTIGITGSPYICSVGIEDEYMKPVPFENYLADGAVSSKNLGGTWIVQSCMAQDITNPSAAQHIQHEIIERLSAKYSKPPSTPAERILIVSVFSDKYTIDDIDFKAVASETILRYEKKTVYEKIFCVFPNDGKQNELSSLVFLNSFTDGGAGVILTVDSNYSTQIKYVNY
jgi:hypothetical protein